MTTYARLLLAALALVLATGCAKKKECTALTDAIKEQRKSFGAGDGDAAADFKKMAKTYKAASEAVGGVTITVPELKKEQAEYVEFMDDMEKAANLTAKVKSPEDFPDADKYAAITEQAKKASAKLGNRSETEMYLGILKTCTE